MMYVFSSGFHTLAVDSPQIPSNSRFLDQMSTWMQYLEKLPCILMLHVLLADVYTGFEEKEM